MYSIGLGLKLRPGAYAGYKKAHDEAWPDLLEIMQRHHVNMIIYKSGERLFVHATAPSEEEWLATRGGPLDEKWNRYMTNYLETDADGNIVFGHVPSSGVRVRHPVDRGLCHCLR